MLSRRQLCVALSVVRLAELKISQRNLAAAGAVEEAWPSRAGYPFMVVLHGVTLGGTAMRGRDHASPVFLGLVLAAQLLRLWAMLSLGSRWIVGGVVPRDLIVETGGPYRLVRHPNYAAILVEFAALPLAYGLPRLALTTTTAAAIVLALRIWAEEKLLFSRPGYSAHFQHKRRIIPGFI